MMPNARTASVALALLVLAAALAWFIGHDRTAPTTPALEVDAAQIDAANEGRRVTIHGPLRVVQPPRDADLGVAASDALALLREVEMLQWRESCEGGTCSHRLDWAAAPVDSDAFREPQGHANPESMPFAAARFEAGEIRLGAFLVDPDSATSGADAVAWPVRVAQLPANLAATFRDCDGSICTGEEDKPAAGDMRVRYRIVPAGTRTLDGTQRGDRIERGDKR
jgi:hypothetical protein